MVVEGSEDKTMLNQYFVNQGIREAELEDFIKRNKHLPGIPSANEIENNDGFEVGAMQQKLLEKIEEQSLYIINLQKQIDELKKLVNKNK